MISDDGRAPPALIYFRLCKSIYIYTDEQHITASFSNIYDYPLSTNTKKTYDFMSIHKLREYSIWNNALKKIEFEVFYSFCILTEFLH